MGDYTQSDTEALRKASDPGPSNEPGVKCGQPGCDRSDTEEFVVFDRDACDCGVAEGWRDDPNYPLDGPPACLFGVEALCPDHAPGGETVEDCAGAAFSGGEV